jgi:hypothetical protein
MSGLYLTFYLVFCHAVCLLFCLGIYILSCMRRFWRTGVYRELKEKVGEQ